MKERGIIMQAHSVRAILDGIKTQTRRIIKPQPNNPSTFGISPVWGSGVPRSNPEHFCIHAATNVNGERVDKWIPCPYGKAGDRLYVKETFFSYGKDLLHYRADNDPEIARVAAESGLWQSSAAMPRWASRLTLEICSIRVQRLQEISEEDAKAEGASKVVWVTPSKDEDTHYSLCDLGSICYRNSFVNLWNSINGKREGCCWADNPWVWAVSFRQVQP